MKRLFLSDIHLNSGYREDEKQARLLDLLHGLDPAEWSDLYLLGDIFDFWFEYRTVIVSAYFPFLHALARLRDGGTRLHMVCGNHDFWVGDFVRQTLDMTVHEDATDMELDGHTVHLFHGDGVNPTDRGYLLLKWFIRRPIPRWLLRQVHPDWVFAIGGLLSRFSRNRGGREARYEASMEERAWMHHYAALQFDRGVDWVVCGHCHIPEIIRIEHNGEPHGYVNCGDWHDNFSYVVWDGREFSLHRTGDDGRAFPAPTTLALPGTARA